MIIGLVLVVKVECLEAQVVAEVATQVEIDMHVNYVENMAAQLLIIGTSLMRHLCPLVLVHM